MGTAMRPCCVSTKPSPTESGPQNTSVTPSFSRPHMHPTISRIASTLPTSCRCTRSTVVPWIAASHSVMSVKARIAFAFTVSGAGVASTIALMCFRCRPCGCGGIVKSTLWQAI